MNRRFQFKEGIKNQGAVCVMRVYDREARRDCLAKAIDKRSSHILYRQASREIALLQGLKSDGFPAVEYAEENEDQLIFYETWINGQNLEEWLKGRPGLRKKKNVFSQICDRISAIHEQGFLYMDLKPEHILIDEKQRVWLIDFNAIIPIGSERAVLSNDLAMPPENGSETLDVQADLPGIGSIHRMMFGAGQISWSCLQENPKKRFKDVQELKKAAFHSPALCGFLVFCLAAGAFLIAGIPGVRASENQNPGADAADLQQVPAAASDVTLERELIAMLGKMEAGTQPDQEKMQSLMQSVLLVSEKNPLAAALFLSKVEVPESLQNSGGWIQICHIAGKPLEASMFSGWLDSLKKSGDPFEKVRGLEQMLKILNADEICLNSVQQESLLDLLDEIEPSGLSKQAGSLLLQYVLMEISEGRTPLSLDEDLLSLLEGDADCVSMVQLYRIKTKKGPEAFTKPQTFKQTAEKNRNNDRSKPAEMPDEDKNGKE